ncbi:MAG: MotA/TolQ/ExbB proton channel family protein [bacterium]
MDPTVIFGIISGTALLIYAIGLENVMTMFVDTNSLLIVLGGTLAATCIHFPMSQLSKTVPWLMITFAMKRKGNKHVIDEFIEVATQYKREGRVGMGKNIDKIKDGFLRDSVQLIIDNVTKEEMQEILDANISYMKRRHQLGIDFFMMVATYCPSFGLVGTLIGLIVMLAKLDDPSAIGPAMAVALITTFYGALFANFLFMPFAGRLEISNEEELLQKNMLKEGLVCLLEGQSIFIIREKMSMVLSQKDRKKMNKKT